MYGSPLGVSTSLHEETRRANLPSAHFSRQIGVERYPQLLACLLLHDVDVPVVEIGLACDHEAN